MLRLGTGTGFAYAKLSEVLPLQRASLASVRMTDRASLIASVRITDWPLVEHRAFGACWYWFRSCVGGGLGGVAVAERVADYFVDGVDEDHL